MEVDVDGGGAVRVWFSEFGISESAREGFVWIEHESGEGMEIREALLAAALAEFYDEHF